MNIRYNFKISLFICVTILCSFVFARAAEELNQEIPALEKIFDLRKNAVYPSGLSQVYRGFSGLDQNTLEQEFRRTLEESGFNYSRDKEFVLGKSKRLRFDRDDLVIDISLFDLDTQGTRIVAREYLNSESSFDLKDLYLFGGSRFSKSPSDINELLSDINPEISKKIEEAKFPNYNSALKPGIKTSKVFLNPIDIPPPPDAQLLSDKLPPNLIGEGASGQAYHSKASAKEVEEFYRRFFKGQRFVTREDLGFNIMAYKRIRFEGNDMAVEIYLNSRIDKSCEVTVVKYSDRNGMTRLETNPFSSEVLPREDNAGSFDLEDIPRPENSVRSSGKIKGRSASITYLLPMTVEQGYNFYFNQMPALGWTLTSEMNTGKVCDDYAKSHNGNSLVPSTFIGVKIDIGAVIKNSYMLEFESNSASAKIMIYSNFVHPKSGSIAYILYNRKKQRTE